MIDELRPHRQHDSGTDRVPAESAGDSDRRAVHAAASTSTRCRAPTSPSSITSAPKLETQMRALPDLRGRDQRSADRESAGQRWTSIATARALGVIGQAIENALTTPTASGRSRRSTRPTNEYWVMLEVVPQYQDDPAHAAHAVRALDERPAGAAQRRGKFDARVGPLTMNHSGQLPAVTISFDLAPGRLARQGRRRGAERSRATCSRRPSPPAFQGTRAGVPEFAAAASGCCW